MRNSVKLRITIWYMISTALITVASVGLLFFLSKNMTTRMMEERLKSGVAQAESAVLFDKDGIRYSPSMEENKDVDVLVYDVEHQLLLGEGDEKVIDLPFQFSNYHFATVDGVKYMVYDYLKESSHHPALCYRSYVSLDSVQMADQIFLKSGFILLPVLVLIATLGGYWITKRAFRPMEKIQETASQIQNGTELDRRIEVDSRYQDEFYRLANTFNEMLNKIQISFENEKQFSGDASHELRTPLAVVRAVAEEMESELAKGELMEQDLLEHSTEVILEQVERMQHLVGQLLMLSRMENDKLGEQKEPVKINELIEVIAEEMREVALQQDIKIDTNCEENCIVEGDQMLFTRMLVNLIDNGIHYGRNGGWIHLSCEKKDGSIIIQVTDNGIGIRQEQLDKIWNRFYQVDQARSDENRGTGLGLYMVRWIVQKYRGEITVSSVLGEGSCFRLSFPQCS